MENWKLMQNVDEELEKIGEKGFTQTNIDSADKLADIKYKMYKADYYKNMSEGGSYERGNYERSYGHDGTWDASGTYGGGRRRDSRGRYMTGDSDSYGRYMADKRMYRANKSSDCKARVMQSLDDYMGEFADKLDMMAQDADCAEERETIEKYKNKIEQLRR